MSLPILAAHDVRVAEQRFPSELAAGTLMQRAAAAVASECFAVFRQHGGIAGRRVLLLVGSGDNGGDALFAGARLARRGVAVSALAVSGRSHAAGASALRQAGGRFIEMPQALAQLHVTDLVIDGIVGLGSTRPLDGDASLIARAVADAGIFTVAIDVPSGVHADTGAVDGIAVQADVTVTFGALRRAHVVAPAALHCGDVLLADIGVPMESRDRAITDEGDWFAPPPGNVDKYARGVVGIVTGSAQYPGAALLSVAAALRSGCGMVRSFGASAELVVAAHPEVVARSDARVAPEERAHAWLVGCGMGVDATALEALQRLLERPEPVIIDADAITLLSTDAGASALLRERRATGRATLLTPHAGELSRLAHALGVEIDIQRDRIGAARAVAHAARASLLLKGPTTLVTDGEHFLATPLLGAHLATAGSGDVLAGLIAGATARWAAAGSLSEADLCALAAAAALRHAAASTAFDTVASDLVDGLSTPV